MYPAYPFLSFNAAITLHTTISSFGHARSDSVIARIPGIAKAAVVATTIAAISILGLLRTVGTISAYQAPLKIYEPLQALSLETSTSSICLGKEWYRFPSSYFLPSNMRARFVKSEFSGLLPGQFLEKRNRFGVPAAWAVTPGMNDQNLEDPGKCVSSDEQRIKSSRVMYAELFHQVDLSSCDFLIDSHFDGSSPSKLEPNHIEDSHKWQMMMCTNFLDASNTPILPRIFWTPDSDLLPKIFRRRWARYCLLKRKAMSA